MIIRRRRFKQTDTLQDRLNQFAAHAREQAAKLSTGDEKTALLKSAAQADRAGEIDRWLMSPGLQPPT